MASVILTNFKITGDSGVEKIATEVWYSLQLSKQTYNYLRTSLLELIDCPCPSDLTAKTAGLITIEGTHLTELKKVWARWFNLKVSCIFTRPGENNTKPNTMVPTTT